MKDLVLSVIDMTTGVVLSPVNLHAVLSTERQAERADRSDSAAFDLATKKGSIISTGLLHAVAAKKLTEEDIHNIADAFGFSVEVCDDGQLVMYTGVK